MISQSFWSKLTPDVQDLMGKIWISNISTYRANAAASQARARKAMEDHGVTFVDPPEESLAASRKLLLADTASLVRDAKLSPEIVRLSEESVNGST
jgi:TRAP-type C4-dicarboxylate transport system substrate-binding protein